MRLRLPKLQDKSKATKLLRVEGLLEDWKNIEEVFEYQGLSYVPKIICSKVIIHHHDNPLTGDFKINKTRELIGQTYYWPSLRKDIASYVKGCDVYLTSKTVRHKLHGDIQPLYVPAHWWKNLLIDFVTDLPLSVNWKSNNYDSILVITDHLTKIVH